MAITGTESRWQNMRMVVEELEVGGVPVFGAQASHIADADNDIAISYGEGDPEITPDGAVTIADGASPTADELLEFCIELNAAIAALDDKVNAIIAALENAGIAASS